MRIVMAPVTVMDHDGNLVEGLQPTDFRLYDNGKLQRVTEDLTTHPLSLVVAVQANGQVEKILPQIQKLGSLLQAKCWVTKAKSRSWNSITAFKVGDCPSDADKMSAALKNIKAGSSTSRLTTPRWKGLPCFVRRPPRAGARCC